MKKKITIVIVSFISFFGLKDISTYNITKNDNLVQNSSNLYQEFSWNQNENSLSLLHKDKVVWQLNFDSNVSKPHFYPLRTLDGIELALLRPDDHPWHRGLWFSWKYINGVNYWEEDRNTGLPEGNVNIKNIEIKKGENFSAIVDLEINYMPSDNHISLIENRRITVSSPTSNGYYFIDWDHKFTSVDDDKIILDRTLPAKFGGAPYGGYAGLAYRANDNDLESIKFSNSEGWVNDKSLTGFGETAYWMNMNGTVKNSKQKTVGITIFDHPSNPRHPTPWYIWYNNIENRTGNNYKHAFFQPSFLFDDQYELDYDESFTLNYRVMIYDGDYELNYFDKEYLNYIE